MDGASEMKLRLRFNEAIVLTNGNPSINRVMTTIRRRGANGSGFQNAGGVEAAMGSRTATATRRRPEPKIKQP